MKTGITSKTGGGRIPSRTLTRDKQKMWGKQKHCQLCLLFQSSTEQMTTHNLFSRTQFSCLSTVTATFTNHMFFSGGGDIKNYWLYLGLWFIAHKTTG